MHCGFQKQICRLGHRFLGITSGPPPSNLTTDRKPENTLSALRELIARGGTGAECDLCLSKDNVPMVVHTRAFGIHVQGAEVTGHVRDYTAAELQTFDIGHGEVIPTLADVLDVIAAQSPDFLLNLELKDRGLTQFVLNTLKEQTLQPEQFLISSFDHEDLARFRRAAGELPLRYGLLFEISFKKEQLIYKERSHETVMSRHFSPTVIETFIKEAPLYSLHPYWEDVTPEMIAFAQKHGLVLCPWTYFEHPPEDDENIRQFWQDLQRQNVAAHMITDYPLTL